jgi:hypothetical protein
MIHAKNGTAARAIFLGVVLIYTARVAGVATAEPNTAKPDRGPAPAAQASTGGAATPNEAASPKSRRSPRRGHRGRTADRAPAAQPGPARGKRSAGEAASLPKLVGKKAVSDDPLGGLKL